MNYRDLIIAKSTKGLVPLSDGAGVISAVGDDVEAFEIGNRVVIGFMPGWVEGEFSAAKQSSALGGGDVNGVLTSSIAVPATGIVKIPDYMSFEQAATLPCAGVTAWSALFERRPVQPGETVLLLGTGGVSIFALQLAKASGARLSSRLVRMKNWSVHVLSVQTTWSTTVPAQIGLRKFAISPTD
ncbi:alcohol dehydrogenase catalytic domain-containing protein (plasmid) [Rhizobium sp. RCAM05350]|uniref:alcohol dehydrogenase catalytic domain-containing protein n=1 Tax=Rhizobium sp. RCAM05350 TaxID=2895568 RepID=UPI00207675C4|nr:alcohol dehydrogenase catalytic domain-containing protein [Rhizobium sp. RCAM05350]URK89386.1 alcohol dehydrogenase catalytic domain-containing protein [Rhizobium sp. RCAM05350]